MPTTIRLADAVKRDLDALQGEFLAERGERLSHSELLARLLRFARANEDRLFADEAEHRPTADDIERLIAGLPTLRVRTDSRDIDKVLYGRRP